MGSEIVARDRERGERSLRVAEAGTLPKERDTDERGEVRADEDEAQGVQKEEGGNEAATEEEAHGNEVEAP